MKSKLIAIVLVLCAVTTAWASVKFYNSSDTDLGHINYVKCSTNVTCAKSGSQLLISVVELAMTGDLSGDGGDQLYGFLQNQITSSATTLTAAQCGSTIVSAGDHEVNLPEASTVLGCRYTFVGGTADTLTIDPADGTDVIGAINFVAAGSAGAIAPAAGDAVSFTDTGASLVLEACGANLWCPIGVANLTITDAN